MSQSQAVLQILENCIPEIKLRLRENMAGFVNQLAGHKDQFEELCNKLNTSLEEMYPYDNFDTTDQYDELEEELDDKITAFITWLSTYSAVKEVVVNSPNPPQAENKIHLSRQPPQKVQTLYTVTNRFYEVCKDFYDWALVLDSGSSDEVPDKGKHDGDNKTRPEYRPRPDTDRPA